MGKAFGMKRDMKQGMPSNHISNTDYHEWLKKENMNNKRIENVDAVFQQCRKDRNAVRILQKMAEHFELTGNPPHHLRPSAVSLIRGIVNGDLDIVNESGKGFWHEEGYEKYEQ